MTDSLDDKINELYKEVIDTAKVFSRVSSVVGGSEFTFREYLKQKFSRLESFDDEGKYSLHYTSENGPQMLLIQSKDPKTVNHYTTAHIDREGLRVINGEIVYAPHYAMDRLYQNELKKFKDSGKDLEQMYLKPRQTSKEEATLIGEEWKGKRIKLGSEERNVTSYRLKENNGVYSVVFEVDGGSLGKYDKASLQYAPEIQVIKDDVGNEIIQGQLDNLINVAALYVLAKYELLEGNVVLTMGSQAGMSGKLLSDFLATDYYYRKENGNTEVLSLDTTPMPDLEFDGVVLRGHDNLAFFTDRFNEKLNNLVTVELDIPVIYKEAFLTDNNYPTEKSGLPPYKGFGNTEAGRFFEHYQKYRTGDVDIASLQLPTTRDGPAQRTSKNALTNYLRSLSGYYNSLVDENSMV